MSHNNSFQIDGLRHWGNIGSSSKQFFFKPDLVDVIIKYLSFNKDSEERKKFVAEQQKRREKMIEVPLLRALQREFYSLLLSIFLERASNGKVGCKIWIYKVERNIWNNANTERKVSKKISFVLPELIFCSILSKLRDNQWTDADIELLKFSGEFDTFAYQPRELTERSKCFGITLILTDNSCQFGKTSSRKCKLCFPS